MFLNANVCNFSGENGVQICVKAVIDGGKYESTKFTI